MDFTREPIIETIITPREGYKLVLRSSKSAGQEEYFVDAVEVVSFGHGLFFRSLERPKAFLVPISDYEVLEVREARMVLKNAGLDRSIKIAGGREGALKASREVEKEEAVLTEEGVEQEEAQPATETPAEARPEVRVDKKRDRRRHYRKRKGREEVKEEAVEPQQAEPSVEKEQVSLPAPEEAASAAPVTPTLLSSLLQPPSTLISETISRYRQNDLFKGAFYLTEEEQYKPHDKVQELLNEEDEDEEAPSLQEPAFEPEVTSEDSAESEKVEENVEEFRPEQEESPQENQEEPSFIDREFQPGLPLYAEEEDLSMMTEEPPYISEQEEEKPVNSNQHHSHQEES